jgi:two-component system repressor protein LuxO
VVRLGSRKSIPIDVRVLAATNVQLERAINAGHFREDLFYRLNVIPVDLPPLRERDHDVLLIARHFLRQFAVEDAKKFTGFSPAVEAALLAYAWPGNVRELQNTVRNIVVLNEGTTVEFDMLPRAFQLGVGGAAAAAARPIAMPAAESTTILEPLDTVVRRTIERAIAQCDGNIPKAAAALQVSPSTIYRRIQAWQAEQA